jgi:azurin
MMPAAELKPLRQRLESLAVAEGLPAGFHRYAFAAIAMADGSFDAAWAQADKSPAARAEMLYAVPLIYDTDLRSKAKDKAMPLIAAKADDVTRRAAIAAAVSMPSEQKAVAEALAGLIHDGEAVGAAARGLRALPQARWGKTLGVPVAKDLVAWAKKVPADKRTSADYLDAVQLASDLATQLPGDELVALRAELKDLRVSVFSITAVREQMRYDTTTLVVEAGKQFEIVFENTDFMPHNLVIVRPGKRPEIGALSMKMKPDEVDGRGRSFIPNSPDVLGGTRLLEAGEKASLTLTAPAEEGVYEYVCTYPGHWEQMWGRLIVTKDVDKYLRDGVPALPAPSGKAATAPDHKHHGAK